MLTVRGSDNSNGDFDWSSNLIDAAIMAALTFFLTLGGLGATGDVSVRELIAAGIAAGTQFLMLDQAEAQRKDGISFKPCAKP